MADYAISNVPRRVVYTNTGVGPYAFTFEILNQTDIAVYRGSTLLTLTTDYSVTINLNGTGSVTLVTAGTGNITIVGAKNIQRTTDFTTGGDLFANTLNDELDNQTIFVQQVAETADRALKAPVTDPTDVAMELPTKQDRANKYLGFDALGNPVSTFDIPSYIYQGALASDPLVRNDGTALQAGDLYFNTTSSNMRVRTSSAWADFGTATPTTIAVQRFSGNGSTTVFTLSSAPAFQNALEVFISGVALVPGVDYTVSGTTLTFTTAPTSGTNNIYVRIMSAYAGGVPNDGSVTTVKIVDLNVTAGKLASTLDLSGKTVTLQDPVMVGAIQEDIFTITDGAAFEIDPSNGTIQLITLGANRTPKATNFVNGESVTLMVDDGTARTLTWTDATFGGSGVVWKTNGGIAPTLNTTGFTVIVLWKVSGQVYGSRVGDA
jgi:hypothetical protein